MLQAAGVQLFMNRNTEQATKSLGLCARVGFTLPNNKTNSFGFFGLRINEPGGDSLLRICWFAHSGTGMETLPPAYELSDACPTNWESIIAAD